MNSVVVNSAVAAATRAGEWRYGLACMRQGDEAGHLPQESTQFTLFSLFFSTMFRMVFAGLCRFSGPASMA